MKSNLKPILYAFVPWLTFISSQTAPLKDQQRLTTALASDEFCKNIEYKFNSTFFIGSNSKQLGLSNRKKFLTKDESYIFLFSQPDILSFWMKKTYIPLDLIFVNQQGRASELLSMAVEKNPENPIHIYHSTLPAIIAIELAPKLVSLKKNLYFCVAQ